MRKDALCNVPFSGDFYKIIAAPWSIVCRLNQAGARALTWPPPHTAPITPNETLSKPRFPTREAKKYRMMYGNRLAPLP